MPSSFTPIILGWSHLVYLLPVFGDAKAVTSGAEGIPEWDSQLDCLNGEVS